MLEHHVIDELIADAERHLMKLRALRAALATGVSDTPVNGATDLTPADLRALCVQEGFAVSLIGEVDAAAACALLGIEQWQLKRLVAEGILEPHRVVGTRRNRFLLENIAQVRRTKGD